MGHTEYFIHERQDLRIFTNKKERERYWNMERSSF